MGERLDQRADQYSLGAVAYAALTGRSPHQVDGLGAAGRVKAAPPPSSLGFTVPDRVDAAIVRALDPDREKRWPDIESFTRELVGGLDETTQTFITGASAGTPAAALLTIAPAAASAGSTSATDETEVGEKTALSESNAPTVIKTGATTVSADAAGNPIADTEAAAATTTGEPAATGAAATTGAASTSTADPLASPASPPRRRRGRWVLAAVLALLLGAGAGFGVQRYLETTSGFAKITQNHFSVKTPRNWMGVVSGSTWHPPGSQQERQALLVSKNTNWNTPNNDTPGVFIGQLATPFSPSKILMDPKKYGCATVGNVVTTTEGTTTYLDQISENCGNRTTLLQRVVSTGNDNSLLIQVQVPESERDTAVEVAASVIYSS
jgi:hypothetical protein